MTFQAHNDGTKWIRIGTPTSNKCISAQWDVDYDEGSNWAGALYACQVDPIPPTSTLRPAKQFWLFIESETVDNAYYIIPMDHLYDMKTRGLQSCTRATYGYKSICLDELDYASQKFMWYITPNGGSVPATTKAVTTTTKAATTTTAAPRPTAVPQEDVSDGTVTVTATRTVTSVVTTTVRSCSRNAAPKIKMVNGAPVDDAKLSSSIWGFWRRFDRW